MVDKSDERCKNEDIATAIFYAGCPEKVGVIFKIAREDLINLELDNATAEMASDGLSRVFCMIGYLKSHNLDPKKVNWSDYKKFLLESQNTDMITLCTEEEFKFNGVQKVVRQFINDMGLGLYFKDFKVSSFGLMKYMYDNPNKMSPDVIGELVCFKTPTDIQNHVPDCKVCIEVKLNLCNPERNPTDYELKLEKVKMRSCMEYIKVPVPDKNYVFWYSSYHCFYDEMKIVKHFDTADEEDIKTKQRLKLHTPHNENCRLDIFEQELRNLKSGAIFSLDLWKGRFTQALRLTISVLRDARAKGWLENNTFPHNAERLVKDLGTYWRLTLLKQSDEELGINPPSSFVYDGSEGNEDSTMSPSREALYVMLEDLAKQYENCFKLNFDWRPKKRKAPTVSSVDSPSKKAKQTSSMLKNATPNFTPPDGYKRFTQKAAENLQETILKNRDISPAKVKPKDCCWQIRCSCKKSGVNYVRVILIAGSMPIYGLTKVVAESYNWRPLGTEYGTATTKGAIPTGSFWTVDTGGDGDTYAAGIIGMQKAVYEKVGKGSPFFDSKKVKVCDVLCKRSDRMTYNCIDNCGASHTVEVIVQGVESNPDLSIQSNAYMTPRVVGASPYLHSNAWNRLNSRLLGYKQAKEQLIFSSCTSEEDMERGYHNHFKYPLLDKNGNIMETRDYKHNLSEMQKIVVNDEVL